MGTHAPPNIRPSWYFAAWSKQLQHSARRPHEEVVADRLLALRRRADGGVDADLSGRALATCERNGAVFVWLGGGDPSFELEGYAEDGWTPMRTFHVDLPTTPATVMADLIDLEHFRTVHGYATSTWLEAPTFEETGFTTQIAFDWDSGIPGLYAPARLWAKVEGLGFQRTEVHALGDLFHSRHLVMPTPRLGGTVRVHAAYSVRLGRFGPIDDLVMYGYALYLGRAFVRDLGRDAQLWVGESDHRNHDTALIDRFSAWAERFRASTSLPEPLAC